MDWLQVLTIVGGNLVLVLTMLGTTVTLFLWARSEAREDRISDINRHEEMKEIVKSIQQEMKDFHGRLVAIEERARVKVYKRE